MTNRPHGTHWHAVIDIGSNSVRLVIYDVAGHALLPHYNEKVMAGLGSGLSETGVLSKKGVTIALKALGRYQAILQGLQITRVRAVATAAVRAAKDGDAFIHSVFEQTGLNVDVLTGAEEARLSAVGVAGGVHKATGLVGDLGGSSLEFCSVVNGSVKKGETLMLGPLSMDLKSQNTDDIRQKVAKALKQSKLLNEAGGRFYMVGGAWRALAKLHMDLAEYPLHLLHGYMFDEKAILAVRQATVGNDPVTRERLSRASRRRVKVLPYASIVLSEVFAQGRFSDAMVSSYGLREGVIIDKLPNEARVDALLDGVALTVRLEDQRRDFGEALYEWVGPIMAPSADLFGETNLEMRLVAAACLLADSGARFHPDTRAKLAFDQALQGPYSNVSHAERAFIATSVAHRYSRQFRPGKRVETLLNKSAIKQARKLGAAMRLGAVFSGRSAAILKTATLSRTDKNLVLNVQPAQSAMVSTTVESRLRTLASQMELKPIIKIG